MKSVYLFGAAMMLLCLSGCKKEVQTTKLKYASEKASPSAKVVTTKIVPPAEVPNRSVEFTQTKNKVALHIKKMTPQESKELFNGVNFLKHKVQPLYCTVYNTNADHLIIKTDAIGLQLLSPAQVKELCVQLSAKRIVLFTILGIITGGILFVTGAMIGYMFVATAAFGTLLFNVSAFSAGVILGAQTPIFSPFNPAVDLGPAFFISGIGCVIALGLPILALTTSMGMTINEKAVAAIDNDVALSNVVVEPLNQKSFLLFTKDYQPEFPLTVQCGSQPITFDVQLPE